MNILSWKFSSIQIGFMEVEAISTPKNALVKTCMKKESKTTLCILLSKYTRNYLYPLSDEFEIVYSYFIKNF